METLRAHAKFHTAHRQLDYDGKCRYVHGHTGTRTSWSSPESPAKCHGVNVIS